MPELIRRFLAGDRSSLARIITLVEDGTSKGAEAYDALYGRVGRAFRVGVTGPPGSGKSTLIRELALLLRKSGSSVGIVAVDPTSPLSGGALLGDRVRMPGLGGDEGIFVRSMATRGSLGGIARTTGEIAELLDAFGYDYVFVETIGVGQIEVDVSRICHSLVVVLVPESGDTIQAMKAGLLEVADIFVVNKADREGVPALLRGLREALDLRAPHEGWREPIMATAATRGEGVPELVATLQEHRRFLEGAGLVDEHRLRSARERIAALVDDERREAFWRPDGREERLRALAESVVRGELAPRAAARALLEEA